ncbi:DUF3224 domain-containing protein [Spirosoma arcticum]
MKITAQRTTKTWNEVPYDELDGTPTLTRSCVTNAYEGGIEGEGWEEYLMLCRHDDSQSFVSMERVIGCIGDRRGSFVMQSVGTYGNGVARGRLTVVPDSGSGDLTGLRGEGQFTLLRGRYATITLDYEWVDQYITTP